MDRLDDPVDAGIAADGLVLGVHEDDLVVLVRGVLVDPVRVEDAQVAAAAADTLLGRRSQGALVLQLVDSLVRRLAVGGTLPRRPLPAAPPDADAVDDIALLGLVSETASLVRSSRAGCAVDNVQLAKLAIDALSANVQRVTP